jgi:hypothetical protein
LLITKQQQPGVLGSLPLLLLLLLLLLLPVLPAPALTAALQ